MVYSSPLRRSALGSISSILNTTSQTPTKQGRVSKSQTPRSSGIRQKIANLFTIDKENSPCKRILGNWGKSENGEVCQQDLFEFVLIIKIKKRGESFPDLLAMELGPISAGKCGKVEKLDIASVVDVSASSNALIQTNVQRPKITPEVRHLKILLTGRYGIWLHYYRVDFVWHHIKSQHNKYIPHFRNYLLYQ